MIELKEYKKPLIILSSIIALFIIILINFKSVGRAPELVRLSKSVAYPGDRITLYGNYFGGEISKGRVTINDQLVFRSDIIAWSDKEITLTLLKDFKSGMISVRNMFGESESHLITSFDDVPRIKTKEEVPGYPFVETIEVVESSENRYILNGRNFGSRQNLSTLVVSNNNYNDSDGFSEIGNYNILSWSDDEIEFYLPYGLKSSVIYVKSSKGFSNYFSLPKLEKRAVSYSYGSFRSYGLRQVVDVVDVVALKGSYIDLFVPCPYEGLNQKNILLNSTEGVYNKISNTFNFSNAVNESGDKFSVELDSSVEVYKLKTKVIKNLVKREYDKRSPNYKLGFERTPGVVVKDRDIRNTGLWLARKNKNPYIQVELIIDWLKKYIKLDTKAPELSSAAFKGRKASELGLVNLTISMLRSSGIPSRIVKGIIVEGGVSRNYQWLEFLLPSGAWIPIDIIEYKKNSLYEIGSLDYNKIVYTKGVTSIEYQEDNFRNDIYALQNTVSNFEGNVERYNTIWHNIAIE